MGFIGEVETGWLNQPKKNHRKMVLLRDFGFRDKDNKLWLAPEGTIINGQSFPEWKKKKSLWWNMKRLVGTVFIKVMSWYPFVGNGRRASVIHDHYSDVKTKPADRTNEVFYEMMLADGQAKWKADIMYQAVKHFNEW